MAVNYKYIIDFVSNHAGFKKGIEDVAKETKAAEAGVVKLAGTVKNDIAGAGQAMSRFAQGDITALPGVFKAGSSTAGIFSKSLHGIKAALIATGIGAIVVAIGTAIGALTRYFKGTEEGQIVFAQVMNKVKAYTEPVLQLFGKLGKSLVQLFKGDFQGAWSTVKESFSQVDDGIKNNIKNLEELNKLEAEIVAKRRQAASEEKRLMAEISDLRNKAKDTENYTAQENLRFADLAIAKQRELGTIKGKLADDELRIAEIKKSFGDNDIATNDRLQELVDERLLIQKQEADGLREIYENRRSIAKLAEQELAYINAMAAAAKTVNTNKLETKEFTSFKTDKKSRESNVLETKVKLNLDEMQKEMPLFQANLEQMGYYLDSLAEKERAVQGAFEQGFAAIGQSIVAGLGLAETGLQGFIGKLLETTTQLIAMMMAQSIANSVAGATQSAVATGPLAVLSQPAFLATMIGGVLAAFAAIPSFFSGGIIPGASPYGDRMLIRANSGEEVLRRDDPRHSANQRETMQAAATRDRLIIPTTRIRKGDIYISYHEAAREVMKRTGK